MKNEIKLWKSGIVDAVTGFLYAPYELYRVSANAEINRAGKFWFTIGWVTAVATAIGLLIAAIAV